MSLETLSRINWVDILAIIILFRITYVGFLLGVGAQIVYFLSLFFILITSLSCYDKPAVVLSERLGLPVSMSEFLSFLCIFLFLFILTKIILKFVPTMRPEGLIAIEQIGGVALGLLRGIMFLGIMLILIMLLPVKGISKSVKHSALGIPILKFNLSIYANTINAVRRNPDVKRTAGGVLSQIDKEKDYGFKERRKDIKEKSRFYKDEF